MFLTKDDLKLSYGVDLKIGAALVDRKVPDGNLYWKNRTIYLPGAPGYIFIPIFTDILLRSGVERDVLLSEPFLVTCETILHSAALHEYDKISWKEHVEQASNTVKNNIVHEEFYNDLFNYTFQDRPVKVPSIALGSHFPSLNRADSYLFSLSTIQSSSFNIEKALKGWNALMTYFLLMDDLADIKDDLRTGQTNVLIDAGLNDEGEQLIHQMINKSIEDMQLINPVMSNRIEHKKSLIDIRAIIQSIRQNF